MPQYKDAVFIEIWRHLKSLRTHQAHLSTLNSPASNGYGVRRAWGDLQANLREERMKKGVGMKAVIAERPDLFILSASETGHPVVGLTPAGQAANPDDGLDAVRQLAASMPALTAETPTTGAEAAGPSAEDMAAAEMQLLEGLGQQPGPAAGGASGLRPPLPTGAVTKALVDQAAAQTLTATAAAAAKSKDKKKTTGGGGTTAAALTGGPVWGGPNKGYYDLIWTPRVEAAKDRERRKEWAMVRALYEAVDSYDGELVTISQMGIDFKVAQLKKDPTFQNEKLGDILKRYEEVFEVIVDSTRGMLARLQPGAQVALPDAEEALATAISEAELMLPERIRSPMNVKDRMQALRIEIVHALHRRGGHASPQDLGQEHRVQKYKANIAQAKKLIDFIKLFPSNFEITYDAQQQASLTLISFDVNDSSMIDMSIQRNNASFSSSGYGPQRNNRFTQGGGRPAPFHTGTQRPMGLPAGQFALHGMPGMPNPLAALAGVLQPASMSGFSDAFRR